MKLKILPEKIKDQINTVRYRRYPVLWQLSILGLILVLLFGSLLWPNSKQNNQMASPIESKPVSLDIIQPNRDHKLDNIKIKAQAAYVYDAKTKEVLFAKNADEPLPLASITKLMTALLSYELVEDNQNVSISDTAIKQEGDNGLLFGEEFSVKNLRSYALIVSSNDAAYALSASVGSLLGDRNPTAQFVEAMNIRAKELGLNSLEFLNPTGLDISETKPGAVGSAKDVSLLMEYILKNYPELLSPTQQADTLVYNKDGQYHEAVNTNRSVDQIPNLLASKTGYTDLAGGNLTVAFNVGLDHPIIITVLGSTYNDRFSDVLTLVQAVRKTFAQIK